MKLTRRELAAAVLLPAAARGEAQSPEESYKAAVEDARKAALKIREFKVPVTSEPAFQFRAQ
ncbi:MAG: hypothetical protein ACM336_05425 [Acidobacteriota bacterium]